MRRLAAATLLEFLPAAAGTWVVAPDLRTSAHRLLLLTANVLRGLADNVAGFALLRFRRFTEGAGGVVQCLLRGIAQEILKCHQRGRAPEAVVTNLGFYVHHQLVENLERLCLVFKQRITLAVTAQANAVAQAVHLVEMLLPQLVNRRENRVPLDRCQFVRLLEADLQ